MVTRRGFEPLNASVKGWCVDRFTNGPCLDVFFEINIVHYITGCTSCKGVLLYFFYPFLPLFTPIEEMRVKDEIGALFPAPIGLLRRTATCACVCIHKIHLEAQTDNEHDRNDKYDTHSERRQVTRQFNRLSVSVCRFGSSGYSGSSGHSGS